MDESSPPSTEVSVDPPAAPVSNDVPVETSPQEISAMGTTNTQAATTDGSTQSVMVIYLNKEVQLKDDVAASVAKHMEDEYEIEKVEDLKHLSKDDIESIIEKTGMKKVSAGKLLDAWSGLQEPKAEVQPTSVTDASRKKGFLPGYSDAGPGDRRGLRLMYLSEETETGQRKLVVDAEKTTDLFDRMNGDALLITVFGPARCGKSFLMVRPCFFD
jgi:hypothetical protein